ncbi:MAG: hypothetical protein JXR96_29560 [Deltaproteobacteria bacterium]|nr:hypothetical protein [Deltaproteobacteria bacterium]
MAVLLLDFALQRSFQSGLLMPYLQGWLREQDMDAHLLRFVIEQSCLDQAGCVGLVPDDLRGLAERIEASRPECVVFSHPPAESLRALVKDAEMQCFDSAPIPDAGWVERKWGMSLRDLLACVPEFSCQPGNPAAAAMRPLPMLVLGPECSYTRSVRESSDFSDLELPPGTLSRGCSFCDFEPGSVVRLPDSAIESHLQAAMQGCDWGPHRRRIRLMGSHLLGDLDPVIEALGDQHDLGVDILLSGRADQILAHEASILESLERLAPTRSRLQLCLVGVESFSGRELERYNKGISIRQVLDLLLLLRRFAGRYPRHFDFDEHGGLSLILYSPWTRIEDLLYNYRLVRLARLEPWCSKLFTSRLRLHPGLPLYHLAARDGLLAESWPQPERAPKGLYPPETPWRFRDPRVARIAEAIARMEDEPLDAAIDLLARLRDEPALVDAPTSSNLAAERMLGRSWAAEERLFASGRRRAGKLEWPGGPERGQDALREVQTRFDAVELAEHPAGGCELFYAHEAASLDALRQASERFGQAREDAAIAEEAERAGRLLGYPACCVEAFARDRLFHVPHHYLDWLIRRYQDPGPIPEPIHPFFSGLAHVPCSCRCPACLDLASEIASDVERSELCGLPVIFLLPDPGGRWSEGPDSRKLVVIEPAGEPCEDGFGYRAVHREGVDSRLDRIEQCDQLRFRDGWMVLSAGGRGVYSLCLEAQIWYPQRALDASFWRPLLACAAYRRMDAGRKMPGSSHAAPRLQQRALLEAVQSALQGRAFEGLRAERIESTADGTQVRFSAPAQGSVRLLIQWREDARDRFLDGRRAALCVVDPGRLSSERLRELVSWVLDRVDRKAGED